MLEGMPLEDNPMLSKPAQGQDITIVYQDDAIVVVNKPAEFLSVPGVHVHDSVLTRLKAQFTQAEAYLPYIVSICLLLDYWCLC